MTTERFKQYHAFLILAGFNLLMYYLFIGNSALDIIINKEGFFDDTLFNYFFGISVLLIIIWLTYFLTRKKLNSTKIIWLHIATASLIASVVPWLALRINNPIPRRYYDYDSDLSISDIFGNMTYAFIAATLLLTISEAFLIINIRGKENKVESDFKFDEK